MSVNIGLLGAGGIAELHADALTRVGNRVAAICDVDVDKAGRLGERYGSPPITGDVPELLGRDDVQAVIVAAPNALHKDLALAGLAAGKDVLLEKPMALDASQCDEIVAAAAAADRFLQVGFVCRGAPTSAAAKKVVDAGRLGRIHHVRASICRRRGIPGLGRWFTTKAQAGGGVLIDLGVHVIDLAMHLIGNRNATRVTGSCRSIFGSPPSSYTYQEMWAGPPNLDGVFDVEDSAFALARFDDGTTFELNATWAANLPDGVLRDGIVILGDRGGLYFDIFGDRVTVATEQDGYLADVHTLVDNEDSWGQAFRAQARSFGDTVTNRGAPIATAEEGRAVQRLIDAIYRSSDAGCEVEV